MAPQAFDPHVAEMTKLDEKQQQQHEVVIVDTPLMNDQYCTVPQSLKVSVGDQVRIEHNSMVAIYTVKWVTAEKNLVRLNGKARLGVTNPGSEVTGVLQGPTAICLRNLSETEAKAQSEIIERMIEQNPQNEGFICIAPHGGDIDLKTDYQAERVQAALEGSSLWMCKGYRKGGGAFKQWHVTSNDISPNSFPELKRIVDAQRKFTRCVAFHGMTEGGVLIGGLGPLEVKLALQKAISRRIGDDTVPVRLATWQDCCNGLSNRNIVNWLTKNGSGGIQIEQDRMVRNKYWRVVADAVIEVFAPEFNKSEEAQTNEEFASSLFGDLY